MFTHTAFSLPSPHTPLSSTTPPRADSRSPSKGGPTNISRSKTGRERRKKNSGLSRFTSSPASSSPGDSGSSSFTSASPTPKPKYRRRVHPLQHIPRLQREPSLETITESDESDVSDGSSTPGLSRSSSVSRLLPSPSLSSLTSLGRLVGLSNGGKGSDGEGEGGEGGWWSLLPAWTRWESGKVCNTNTEHKDAPSSDSNTPLHTTHKTSEDEPFFMKLISSSSACKKESPAARQLSALLATHSITFTPPNTPTRTSTSHPQQDM
ncbi:hypothetical protein L202_07610 [Cryptococcus amylolentus CBS 6039]|uniref:Uncharacterized protein n=1 Tax=Cryptococcus amylolentus CBS 6039 TaxID=1295533 RepID=A0A1E3HCU1_9TREE|nr:hypothetical protein L202_07610 [Cryptococcus amylolentus CBS 6039]ODN74158.1 hypothetical protein L202_07610 [Cryptococcus amylolentus CBS 6039]